jgi:virginiamycin B lyase
VTEAGNSLAGWRSVLQMMIHLGARLPSSQIDTVAVYLANNFPARSGSAKSEIPGPVSLTFQEWTLPTPATHPHDPLAAADGSIWYTGQMANVLGRIDPHTGAIREYRLPVANSGPHGLTEDDAGDVWFTANFAGYIGRLDPKTATFHQYPLPDASARDPHTPLFDRAGIMWFTVQGANMVGRLDPRSGDIHLVRSPTPNSSPYGLVIASTGVPYFAEFGTNKLASIDPNTMTIREYSLPNPGSRPRRLAITPKDVIYYTDYARGMLGRFDPHSGVSSEWPSPGGPHSYPYAIAWLKGAAWYSESGVQPNTLVRFDPGTGRFQTWAIPGGGGRRSQHDADTRWRGRGTCREWCRSRGTGDRAVIVRYRVTNGAPGPFQADWRAAPGQ